MKMVLSNCEGEYGIHASIEALQSGDTALNSLIRGIKLVEDDIRAKTVGFGGKPNILGHMECDGAVMDGTTLEAGSIGALSGYRSAASLAHEVMKKLPHVMLVGEGAARFAKEVNAEPAEMLSPCAAENYQKWLSEVVKQEIESETPLSDFVWQTASPRTAKGTTVFVGIDDSKNIAAATSTSGWGYCYPGRLGDSPVIGAGLYADSRYGACACTHTGEMTIRSGTAISVIRYMKKGASVKDAAYEAFEDLRSLKGGYLGAVVLHAIDKNGEPFVLSTGNDDNVLYWHWQEGMNEAVSARPVIEAID